jgi:hypothetical protein
MGEKAFLAFLNDLCKVVSGGARAVKDGGG